MTVLRAVIVDDEASNRRLNRQLLDDFFPDISVVAEADSVDTAVEKIKKHDPDLVLLDIEIKGGSGFQVLQKLKPYRFKVVFITAFDHFAIRAFKFSASDYILKPVNETDFQQAIKNALSTLRPDDTFQQQNDYLLSHYAKSARLKKIVLRTAKALHIVDLEDIVYCRSDNAYTSFFLISGEEIIVSKGMKDYAGMLKDYGFFRPHQSYLVNINYVKKVDKSDGGFVVMKNNKEIPVSSRQKKGLIEMLENL